MKKRVLIILFLLVFSLVGSGISVYAADGFYVEDGRVYDANDNEFVIRGINHAHTWFKGELDTSLAGIAETGANSVRVVLSNGGQWTKDSKSSLIEIIEKLKEHNLIGILEIHDATGYGSQYAQSAVHMSTAVDYWIEMKDVLIGQEEYVMINIANEPFGNDTTADVYVNDHITAISRLRNEGFDHALIVDGSCWGQDWKEIMKSRAIEIFNGDPNRNVIFSVHMYEVYQSDSAVNNYMQTFINNNLPLIVGEFGADHKGQFVDADSIMSRAEEYGLGYIGWSWKGNNEETASLDIANDWAGNSLSSWGDMLVNGTNGLRATAERCTVFNSNPVSNLGDLNNDNNINAIDYALMRRYILETDNNISVEAADVNEDGSVNAIDYTLMRRYLLEQISQF